MNAQQAHIRVLIERAAEQYLDDGVVDLNIQTDLAAEGYALRSLQRDIDRVLADR